MENENRLVYIQPSGAGHQELLPMTRGAARFSGYLQDIIDLMDQQAFQDNAAPSAVIPLGHQEACNTATMKNIIRWCEYHCDDPKFNRQKNYGQLSNSNGAEERAVAAAAATDDDMMMESSPTRNVEESTQPSFWDRRFLADIAGDEDPITGWKNRADLYDLLIAAHFLQINPIVEIGGKFICQTIRDRNVEQVRSFLGITNDLTEEETRTIQTENEWAFNRGHTPSNTGRH